MFCRRSDGGFVSREHIFSEALGNVNEKVLPPGVVCDRCNNGPLAQADEELVNLPVISMLRAERGIPTKGGKAVMSKWGNARIVYPARGTLQVIGPSKDVVRGMDEFDPEKGIPGTLKLETGWRLTEARIGRIARSIWKSTLEFIYLDHGVEIAYAPRFDEARKAIIDDGEAYGWVLVPVDGKPGPNVELTYNFTEVDGRQAVAIRMDIFGVVFATDLLLRDFDIASVEHPIPVNVWTFSAAMNLRHKL